MNCETVSREEIGGQIFELRGLRDDEIDQVIARIAHPLAVAIDRHVRVGYSGVTVSAKFTEEAGAFLFEVAQSVLPLLIAFGCDEPDQVEAAKRLPITTAIFCAEAICLRTIQLHGVVELKTRLATAVARHSQFQGFVEPWITAVMSAGLQKSGFEKPNQSSNRAARRRARKLH